jgi:hypothetical protein
MKSLWICCQVLPLPPPSVAGGVSASATVDWAASLIPAVPPLPPPSVVALPPEPPNAARSTPASATVVALPPEPPDAARSTPASATVLPPESVVWPPVPLWPPGPEEAEVAPPVVWPPVPAELEEGDVVPPDNRVDESVLVAPPPWPPVWIELSPVVPPVDAPPPLPELPAGRVAPPADPSWFTLGALLLQARPIAHANRADTSLVFMGVGNSGECDGFEGSFHAQASQFCQGSGWGDVVLPRSVIAVRAGREKHAAWHYSRHPVGFSGAIVRKFAVAGAIGIPDEPTT